MAGGFSAVLALGDTQYHVGALSDFDSVFDQTWGRVKPIIRPTVGNHEYSTSNARGYFDYFNGEGSTTARPASATRATTASTSAAGT